MKTKCPRCKKKIQVNRRKADCYDCHKSYDTNFWGSILNPFNPINIVLDPYGIWHPVSDDQPTKRSLPDPGCESPVYIPSIDYTPSEPRYQDSCPHWNSHSSDHNSSHSHSSSSSHDHGSSSSSYDSGGSSDSGGGDGGGGGGGD